MELLKTKLKANFIPGVGKMFFPSKTKSSFTWYCAGTGTLSSYLCRRKTARNTIRNTVLVLDAVL
jgi:hypothetical protein